MTARRTLLVALVAAFAATSVYLAVVRRATGDFAAIVSEGQRQEELDHRLAVSRRVVAGIFAGGADLMASRVTLGEAAGRFRELNTLLEGDPNNDSLAPYRVVPGEEGLWRIVYFWAETELYHRRDQAAGAVLSRLKVQFRERFGCDPEPFPASSFRPDAFRGPPANRARVATPPAQGSQQTHCPRKSAVSRSPPPTAQPGGSAPTHCPGPVSP